MFGLEILISNFRPASHALCGPGSRPYAKGLFVVSLTICKAAVSPMPSSFLISWLSRVKVQQIFGFSVIGLIGILREVCSFRQTGV